jgi:predicted dehydrogenase
LNIGIVGCGLIGQKRAASSGNNILKAVADVSFDRAQKLACCYKDVKAFSDWRKLVELNDIELVIVSTTNNWLAPVTLEAVESGKHVLVEKPGA